MQEKKLYGTATVGTKGQVVIPAAAREELAIREGDRLYAIGSKKGEWIGFIKEDKLAELMGHLVDNVDFFQQALEGEAGRES